MADIRSRPSTDLYRKNWDRIFRRIHCSPTEDRTALLVPWSHLAMDPTESYDSHPQAD